MLKNIQVLTIEDGGNPRTKHDIKREKKGFFIRPFSEDGDGNYRFRLNVKLVNSTSVSIPVLFNIEWGDTEHQDARKYVLLSKEDGLWEMFSTEIIGTKASVTINVPPGQSFLCMHPRYEYERYECFLKNLPKDLFRISNIGRTRHNRKIYGIQAGNESMRPLAILCRVHPYETIGSFFVEGMLRWLMSDCGEAKKFLIENHVVFVPMPNPDGVIEGTCKRTLGGLNFSTDGSITTEPEGIAVREYFLKKNPISIFDFHGWMYHYDNIVTNDPVRGKSLYLTLVKDEELFATPIELRFSKYPWVGKQNNLGGLLVDKVGAVYYNSSWSWYDRTADDLFNMGVRILRAYADLFNI